MRYETNCWTRNWMMNQSNVCTTTWQPLCNAFVSSRLVAILRHTRRSHLLLFSQKQWNKINMITSLSMTAENIRLARKRKVTDDETQKWNAKDSEEKVPSLADREKRERSKPQVIDLFFCHVNLTTYSELRSYKTVNYHSVFNLRAKMNMAVFWVVAPCSLVEAYRRLRRVYWLHHQEDHSGF
jgi:hypothetical protein